MSTECLTSETIVNIVSSGGNKYVFNNSNTYSEDKKYGLGIGTYIFKNVPEAHPIAILNTNIQYVGDSNKKFTYVLDDGNTYDFYWGDVTVTISNDFGLSSVYCLYHGYMGGENLLVYSESCLLEPEPPPPPPAYNKRCVLRFRRGTASEWTSSSPQPDGEVLKLGEPGYEKDTGKLKIGDGVSGWNDLAYLQAENSEDVILTQEDVDDAVANLLVQGSGIVLSYDDDQNSLTISTSGLQPAGNYATLVNGLVPENELPSYVDDVLEFANLASFPNPGEAGKIYVTLDTNKTYRWSGSTYIEISSGPSNSDDVPEGSGNLYYTNDRVDDLLKAGSYINISYDSVDLTISATGLQPSGDYSVVGHSHVVNDITDFSAGVSGLLPTISDPADNRLLTSDGTSTGINAESNLVFSNNNLTIGSTGLIASSTNVPQINIYSSVDESARIKFLDSEGNEQLQIIYDEEDVESLIVSLDPLRIQAFAPITIDSQTSNVLINTPVGSGLYVNNVLVSVSGHTHTASSITDFSAGVSGLLPSVSGSGFVVSSFEDNVYTISVTGVQPSGNYSVDGHTHIISEVSGLQTALDSKQPSGVYASGVHSHVVNDITDFSSSVSGLLPTISNPADNRLLTSDGTSTGINAESNVTFNESLLSVTGNVLIEKTNASTLEIRNQSIGGVAPGSNLQLTVHADNPPTTGENPVGLSTPRISARKTRGTLDLPSILNDNEPLLSIRVQNINESGTYHVSSRISSWSDGVVLDSGNQPTRLEFSTSPGSGAILSNTLALYSDGELNHNGYMIVEDGLSAPTPIHNLGAVSGNVSISYGVDKQIQTLSLNGTNTNFIEGSDWPTTNSVDVLLEITVTTPTSVTWTIVDDFYNPVPASLSVGKHLVLLRSIGATIQGHYIGEKTN